MNADVDASEARLNHRHRDDLAEYEGEEDDKNDLILKDPNALLANELDEIMEDSEADQNFLDESPLLNGEKQEEDDDEYIDQKDILNISSTILNGNVKTEDAIQKLRSDRINVCFF